MIDLTKYADDVVLSTKEAMEWMGAKDSRVVLRLGVKPLKLFRKQHYYRVGDLKRAILGEPAIEPEAHRAPGRPTILPLLRQPA